MSNYKNPVCRGSFMLGTACGKCERCMEQKENMNGEVKKSEGEFIELKVEDYEKLKAQLERAEKILSYYASEDTWIKKELDKDGNLHQWWDKTPNDKSIFPYSISKSNGNFNCLGRRAREYFKEKGQV